MNRHEKFTMLRNEEDERRAVCGSDDDDLGPQVSPSYQSYSNFYVLFEDGSNGSFQQILSEHLYERPCLLIFVKT